MLKKWSVILALFSLTALAHAEIITMSVVDSSAVYQRPDEVKHFVTVFQNGSQQLVLKTKFQYHQDIWYDITRTCVDGKCKYESITVSDFQSVETMAIIEIIERERMRPFVIHQRAEDF